MRKSKKIIVFALFLIVAFTLFAQNAQVKFQDETSTTAGYLNLEYPGGSYPAGASTTNRWKMVIYKSTDNIIDPLVNGLPTGDDIILTNPDQGGAQVILNVNLSPGTTYKLNLSYAVIHVSMIPTYIYGRLFNSTSVATATKYMSFTAPYYVAAGLPVNVPIMPNYGWKTDPVWQWIVPQPTTHIISGTITSQWDLSNVAISATDIDPADITYAAGAYTVTVPDGWDGTVIPTKAGYIFEPASYTYTDVVADTPNQDFVMKTVVAPGVPTNLSPNGTTLTYTEPTAVVLTWDAVANAEGYKLIWNNGEIQDLGNVLTWTTPVLDAGTYTWKVCAYNNTPTKKINTPVRVQMNGRSTSPANSPKADGGWAEASFIVEIEITPQNYTVEITSVPVGAAIYVGGVDSGQITPYTFTLAAGANATYTVMMDHYTWEPDLFEVINISDNLSCNFVGTFNFTQGEEITPPGVPSGSVITIEFTQGSATATIGTIGTQTPAANPAWNLGYFQFMTLLGAGPWDLIINTNYEYVWIVGVGVYTGPIVNLTITPLKNMNVEVQYGNGGDPTLPVELSYFAATLTAENFVNIAWTTQTETNMNGFNIYRNDSDNLASAIQIAYIPATNTSTTQNYKHIDREVENGNTYYYWLECVETNGESIFNGPSPVYVDGPTPPVLPEYTIMHNAYPNPFRAGDGTTIKVDVKAGDTGTVTIYNILGQVVKTFPVTQGRNDLTWNARDSKGNLCGNGIYFYKLSTNSLNQTKKMVIVK